MVSWSVPEGGYPSSGVRCPFTSGERGQSVIGVGLLRTSVRIGSA